MRGKEKAAGTLPNQPLPAEPEGGMDALGNGERFMVQDERVTRARSTKARK